MVFISYSNKDSHAAAALRDELETNHYQCFLAHDDIEATADWHEEIWKELHESDAFVGLITEAFNSSAFCQQEIGAALALAKPSLLVFGGTETVRVPGFAARFQAVKPEKLLAALSELPKFRQLRVDAWIQATKEADSFKEANAVYSQFRTEWQSMADDEKLRWVLAGDGNSQVRDEGYGVGPFFRDARRSMRRFLVRTKQGLYVTEAWQGEFIDGFEYRLSADRGVAKEFLQGTTEGVEAKLKSLDREATLIDI